MSGWPLFGAGLAYASIPQTIIPGAGSDNRPLEGGRLFLPDIDLYRAAGQGETLAELVFEEALVGLLDVLREVAEEGEGRETSRQLGDVLDLHVFALPCRRRGLFDYREQGLVQASRRDLRRVVRPDLGGGLEHVLDALHLQDRGEYDRDVVKGGETAAKRLRVVAQRVVVLDFLV